MKAVRFQEYGGPEALEVVDVPEPSPGRGEVGGYRLQASAKKTCSLMPVAFTHRSFPLP
jgi:hypothetical protein